MAEVYETQLRSYEVSIWTLQDSFVTVLKPSELEHKGQIQEGIFEIGDDGTEHFTFSIPMYYQEGDTQIMNPLWTFVVEGHLVANMHKVKLIFNKATEDEEVYELLVVAVTQLHEQDNIKYTIECEGLAFHELGKLGYKISLSGEDFDDEYIKWFEQGMAEGQEAPRQTIQYWNDKIFYHEHELMHTQLARQLNHLQRLIDEAKEQLSNAQLLFEKIREEYSNSDLSKIFSFSENDPLTYVPGGLEFLSDLQDKDEDGNAKYTIREQYEKIVEYNVASLMAKDKDGNAIEQGEDEEAFYAASVQAFWDTLNDAKQTIEIAQRNVLKLLLQWTNYLAAKAKVKEQTRKYRKYDWDYEVNMDWSSCSAGVARVRDPHKVYEEEIVTSWETDRVKDELYPSNVESYREKWRAVESEESNIYNLTQTIAEKFGVYCKYVYDHDENYHIIGKRVVYYNNNFQDSQKHVDITYPYTSSSITRIVDNTELATKLFVRPVESDMSTSNLISITTVESNKSKEDYILNFDYLKKINTINQEQYDAIEDFIFEIARLNNRIRRLDTQIRLTQNKLITAEADESVYQSAITLDTERINNANLLLNQLTGEDQVIFITEANPTMVILRSANDSASKDLKQVRLQYEGILPESVELYKKLNLGVVVGNGRLSELVPTGNFVYDEFGNPTAITNIYIPDPDLKRLYMTCQYSPRLYYSRVGETWQKRLNDDQIKLAEAQARVEKYNLLLYGCDVDYARATLSRVEYVSAGTSIADFVIGHNDRGQEIGEYGSYIGEAELEEAHGYILMREIFLLKKSILIAKFEKMMGPALREGYWSPEDYDDYGNKYNDVWYISDNTTTEWPGTVRSDLIKFVWDTYNIFEGESKISYEIGVTQDIEYYLLIDLTDYLSNIKSYIKTNTLSFIYYDQQMLALNSEIEAKNRRMEALAAKASALGGENKLSESEQLEYHSLSVTYNTRMEAIPRNIKNARRWFTLGANCEIVYVQHEGKYKPALMITGLKDLMPIELRSVYTSVSGYEPFLGYVESKVIEEADDEGVIHTNIDIQITRLTQDSLASHFLNVGERNATYEEQYNSLLRAGYGAQLGIGRTSTFYSAAITNFWNDYKSNKDAMDALNTSPWDITTFKKTYICIGQDKYGNEIKQAFPRIAIDSIELNTKSVLLAINKKARTEYEDYSILIEEDLATTTEKYFVNIKPAVLAAEGSPYFVLDIDYAISNAAEAIYYDALKVSKENAFPKVSYEVALNMLYPDLIKRIYTLLRRVVYINDVDLLLEDVAGYISKITIDLDHPWQDKIEVKNYETKFEDLFSTIVAQTEEMKKSEVAINYAAIAFSSGGIISSNVLQESMLKADLNYSFNQGTLTIDEKNGIWAVSDAGVVAIRGGGIFTASEKDTTGAWKWNTGILPTGINADLITTGQLDTNKIYIYAGDKVRFQMNGEGLFAYKALFEDQIVTDNDDTKYYIQNKTEDIDASQYITYNENGLFLVARKNALVLNREKNDYIRVGYQADKTTPLGNFPTELRRVEIGWDGLILRDWTNQDVFYADPDTGNLTLKGTIETFNGKIGGWTIGPNSLTSKNVSFFSSEVGSNEFSGIRLTASQSQTQTFDGVEHYAYKIKDSDDTTIYYNSARPTDGIDTLKLTSRNNTCIYYAEKIQGVQPLATITDTSGIYIADPTTNKAIVLNGNRIVYNGSTSTSSTWYVQLTNWANMTNHEVTDYVKQWTGSMPTSITLPVDTELVLDSDSPSFLANAMTGEVRIAKGIFGKEGGGGFVLKANGLYDGTLYNTNINSNSRIAYGNSLYGLDQYQNCFNRFSSNSSAGTFTLTRINGDPVTFNMADTKFFRDQMSAAVVIHNKGLSLSGSEASSTVNVDVWTDGQGYVRGDSYSDSYYVGYLYTDGQAYGESLHAGDYNRGWNECVDAFGTVYTITRDTDEHFKKITVQGQISYTSCGSGWAAYREKTVSKR